MRELATPRAAFVLERGLYDQRRERVVAGTPASLPAFADRQRNRLGLARWLTDPDHPLTARVAVNRYWQLLFGRGLVETIEDLRHPGRATEPPALTRLVGAALRRLRLERQATVAADGHVRDLPADVRVLRGAARARPRQHLVGARTALPTQRRDDPRRRAAGVGLVGRPTGRTAGQAVPTGRFVGRESGGRYVRGKGDDLYRRSLYTFWKRTSPPPSMIVFDAPRRQQCAVRRFPTDTPLQALVLWNDPQFVECARVLAERAMRRHDDDGDRATWIFRALTSRLPTDRELAILRQLIDDQRSLFGEDPARAEQLLAVGDRPRDPQLPATELAAMTMLSSALLSYDEAVTKR